MSGTQTTTAFVLNLTAEERTSLLQILEQALAEVHSESRRTEAPAYQKKVHHEEALIRSLTEKVRRLGS